MKLSDMKQLIAEHGVRLSKSLGQNFLHDANQLRRILAAAELTKTDKVLEIGPGLGPLTALLIQQAGEVLAIEKDARLLRLLEQRFASELSARPPGHEHKEDAIAEPPAVFHLIHGDALDYLQQRTHDWGEWKLVANLPYSVASPILVELAQVDCGPERMVATLQMEVTRRLMANPGDADYGLLTLLIQMNYQPQSSFKIPASCFFPEPEVDSACITLIRRRHPLIAPEFQQTFTRIVKRGFSQRRKMMLKLLKQEWSAEELDHAFQASHLAADVRAETVGLEQFAQLTIQLHNKVGN